MSLFPKSRRVVNGLRLLWVVLALWYEYFVFYRAVKPCVWPDRPPVKDPASTTNQSPKHILLVADPQILDHRSYPGRSTFLTYLSRVIVDLNLRKNWLAATSKNPNAVVFLGDMMDGGRMDMPSEEYEEYYARFKTIFSTDRRFPQFFIPGNHDTGLQARSTFSPYARTRYISHFGPLNDRVSVANHTLLFFDAPGFVQEDYERAGKNKPLDEWRSKPEGSFDFVRRIHNEKNSDPIVLFTHIPLYRPDGKSCGPLREKGTIRAGVGFGYQNTIGKHSTAYLLELLQPVVAYSGDDHDYCEYTHQSVISHPVREVTVKSLSMAMNVRKPAFQMLTLYPEHYWDSNHSTYADIPCILPDQLGIYLGVYIPFLIVSFFALTCAVYVRNRRAFLDMSPHVKHLPEPASRKNRTHNSAVCCGRRRHIPSGLGYLLNYRGQNGKRAFVHGLLVDTLDIAIFPISIFVAVTFWVYM